jgi:hypothetical protein
MSNNASAAEPKDSPLMKAWEAYKLTDDYRNSLHWALRLAPHAQAGSPEQLTREEKIMPHATRKQNIEGSLWASFYAGFNAKATP